MKTNKLMLISFSSLLMAGAQAGTNLKTDASVPADQAALFRADLAVLDGLSELPADRQLQKIMHLPALTQPALSNWLEERVQVIIGQKVDAEKTSYVEKKNYAYENPDLLPDDDDDDNVAEAPDAPTAAPETNEAPDDDDNTLMQNVGISIYQDGKTSSELRAIDLSVGKLEVTSPRTGIIQVGAALFNPKFGIGGEAASASSHANSLYRLSTLFHEARHSDGRGKTLGFQHVKCPAGHDLAGDYACDNNLNGPYTLDALLTKQLILSCTDCTVAEKEALKLQTADSLSRVVATRRSAAREWDDHPEGHR
ncbi:MAG: hypothetical protein JST16_00075 [Bdellovibrionales bacterium]|nr:hypothetical protein [Bdellovibrionales bacterium]